MFLLDWYKQWLDIRTDYRAKNAEVKEEETVCKSCETLKQQLEIANYEKKQLLDRIMAPPVIPEEKPPAEISKPRMVPWNVRRQMLEREDREKARLMKEAPKPDSEIADVAALEREMDLAAEKREQQSN